MPAPSKNQQSHELNIGQQRGKLRPSILQRISKISHNHQQNHTRRVLQSSWEGAQAAFLQEFFWCKREFGGSLGNRDGKSADFSVWGGGGMLRGKGGGGWQAHGDARQTVSQGISHHGPPSTHFPDSPLLSDGAPPSIMPIPVPSFLHRERSDPTPIDDACGSSRLSVLQDDRIHFINDAPVCIRHRKARCRSTVRRR